ncbi:MAG: hypothetical protein KTR32_42000 [Granulosicoccus sp.]|nr:hypothetical protein [Granulosicoccus sp.]
MNQETDIDILFLRTSLFGNAPEFFDNLTTADGIRTDVIELDPEQMVDADWDNIIYRSLHAKKVVTL